MRGDGERERKQRFLVRNRFEQPSRLDNPFDLDAFQRGLSEIDESENSSSNREEKRGQGRLTLTPREESSLSFRATLSL